MKVCYFLWVLLSVAGIVMSDLYDTRDCVPALQGPPSLPSPPSQSGLSAPPGSHRGHPRYGGIVRYCKYIGRNGECYRFSGVYSEDECRKQYGDDQYEIWVAKQNWVDRNNAHHRFSDPIGPVGPRN